MKKTSRSATRYDRLLSFEIDRVSAGQRYVLVDCLGSLRSNKEVRGKDEYSIIEIAEVSVAADLALGGCESSGKLPHARCSEERCLLALFDEIRFRAHAGPNSPSVGDEHEMQPILSRLKHKLSVESERRSDALKSSRQGV